MYAYVHADANEDCVYMDSQPKAVCLQVLQHHSHIKCLNARRLTQF